MKEVPKGGGGWEGGNDSKIQHLGKKKTGAYVAEEAT